MTLHTLTPSGAEPVSLGRAKEFLRVEHEAEDELIAGLIAASRERVEAWTGRALIARTLRETLDGWDAPGRLSRDGRAFALAAPPLISVASVTLYGADGAASVWDADNYFVDAQADPGRIALTRDRAFPRPGRGTAGIEIVFEAGYGQEPEDVPAGLREAVLRLTADGYENREGEGRGFPASVIALLAPWRRARL